MIMASSYIRKGNKKYTVNITMDLYSHVLKDMNEDAADRLNDVIYK